MLLVNLDCYRRQGFLRSPIFRQRLNDLYQEKTKAIIIDFGLKYTKVGFAQESEPRKILQTPQLFNLNSYFADKVKNTNIFLYQNDIIEAKLKIEEFIYYVVHFVLQLKKELLALFL